MHTRVPMALPRSSDCAEPGFATAWNSTADAFFLDRYDLPCPDSTAMTRFQMQTRNAGTQMRFTYMCEAPVPVTNMRTSWMSVKGRNYSSMAATCNSTQAIQRWSITRVGENQALIDTTCSSVDANWSTTLKCYNRSTPMTDYGGSAKVLLDFHNVQCGWRATSPVGHAPAELAG